MSHQQPIRLLAEGFLLAAFVSTRRGRPCRRWVGGRRMGWWWRPFTRCWLFW